MAKLDREEVTFSLIVITPIVLFWFQRAAERYAGTTPEELESRRRRGWGNDIQDNIQDDVRAPSFIWHNSF